MMQVEVIVQVLTTLSTKKYANDAQKISDSNSLCQKQQSNQ